MCTSIHPSSTGISSPGRSTAGLHSSRAFRKIGPTLGGHDVPHNFIRISADTPNPGRRRENDVKAICEKHQGTLGCLLFDSDTNPEFAYVLVKNGNLNKILAALDGTKIETYFDPSELKN
jgi:hypothetical protein